MKRLVLLLLVVSGLSCDGDTPSNPQGPRCGPITCASGQTCCNASCGTCVSGAGACTLQACNLSPCATDADCRTFSFPCNTCQCWALRTDDPTPSCPAGQTITCLVDPCLNRSARCQAGRCVVE